MDQPDFEAETSATEFVLDRPRRVGGFYNRNGAMATQRLRTPLRHKSSPTAGRR